MGFDLECSPHPIPAASFRRVARFPTRECNKLITNPGGIALTGTAK